MPSGFISFKALYAFVSAKSNWPPGSVIVWTDSISISDISPFGISFNWSIFWIPNLCKTDSCTSFDNASNLKLPVFAACAKSINLVFSSCVAIFNNDISLFALSTSPTPCSACDSASLISLYWPLSNPPVAAVCLPIRWTIWLSTSKFAGNGDICNISPCLL